MKNTSIEIPVTLDNFIYSNHIVLLREHDNKVILLILTAIIYYSIFSLFQCQIKLYTDILKIKKVIKSTSKVLKLIKKVSFFIFSIISLGNILVNDIYQNQYSVTLWDQFSSYKLKILAYF